MIFHGLSHQHERACSGLLSCCYLFTDKPGRVLYRILGQTMKSSLWGVLIAGYQGMAGPFELAPSLQGRSPRFSNLAGFPRCRHSPDDPPMTKASRPNTIKNDSRRKSPTLDKIFSQTLNDAGLLSLFTPALTRDARTVLAPPLWLAESENRVRVALATCQMFKA
jgi:hypothetical protein